MKNTTIITLPNGLLRKPSAKVSEIDEATHKLIKDMETATIDWEKDREHETGVALAAVQIGKNLRVVVARNRLDDNDNTFTAFINPTITRYDGELEPGYEGCLSITGIYGVVPRYTKIEVEYQTIDGKKHTDIFEGYLARILQHEIDHINGIMFIDRIEYNQDAFYKLNAKGDIVQLDYEHNVKGNDRLWCSA